MNRDADRDARYFNNKRWTDVGTNWCKFEADASMKCLSKNNYDKSKCQKYFDEYVECKKELNQLKSERRKQGLHPMPTEPRKRPSDQNMNDNSNKNEKEKSSNNGS